MTQRNSPLKQQRKFWRPSYGLASVLRWLLLALPAPLFVVVACDPGSLTADPSLSCTESGVQCQLPTGPLGVCERSACDSGETPPCFQCTPQH